MLVFVELLVERAAETAPARQCDEDGKQNDTGNDDTNDSARSINCDIRNWGIIGKGQHILSSACSYAYGIANGQQDGFQVPMYGHVQHQL